MVNRFSVSAKFSTRSVRLSVVILRSTSSAPNARAAAFCLRFQASDVSAIARSTRNSPAPIRVIGASSPGSRAGFVYTAVWALFISIALMRSGDRFGKASMSKAAAPATIGVAPDVPPKAVCPVPVPACAETDAPGAPISGLICWVLPAGPREDVLAMLPTSAMAEALENDTLTSSGAARRALIAADSDC